MNIAKWFNCYLWFENNAPVTTMICSLSDKYSFSFWICNLHFNGSFADSYLFCHLILRCRTVWYQHPLQCNFVSFCLCRYLISKSSMYFITIGSALMYNNSYSRPCFLLHFGQVPLITNEMEWAMNPSCNWKLGMAILSMQNDFWQDSQ